MLGKKRNVENPSFVRVSRDIESTDRAIVQKNDLVVCFGKMALVMLLLCRELESQERFPL
jgi:hypothetical protein